MNTKFKEIFGGVRDLRFDRTKLYKLLDIIALEILEVIASAQGFEEIEDFGHAHEKWLKRKAGQFGRKCPRLF